MTWAPIARTPRWIDRAGKIPGPPRSAWRRRSSFVRNLPSSAPAQHAGGIAAVIDDRNYRRVTGILRGAAQAGRRAAALCKSPGRIAGLLDRHLAVRGGDHG